MLAVADTTLDEEVPRDRLALLLKHFSEIKDDREPWRVLYPLTEVMLLVVCATICSCDDFDDMAAWGQLNLDFLRRFSRFHHGIPCERWLRILVNRIDPILFRRCFESWVAATWPDRPEFIAIDGKTSRRTHDRRKGIKALHTLSAYATTARLVLAQTSVREKTNEITAIPELLDDLAEAGRIKGALVTIDAMGCQVGIADRIVAHEADYLLALKSLPSRRRGAISPRSKPMSQIISAPLPNTKSSPRPPSRKDTDASKPAPTPSPTMWIGSSRKRAIRDSLASPMSGRSSWCRSAPNIAIAASSIPDITSPRLPQHRTPRKRRPRPLGRRKHALAARRRVRRRSLPIPLRPRRQKHGRRPPFRPRPRPRKQNQRQR